MHQKNQYHKDHQGHAFAIERIAFFSDAVFAIAITLMVIDIHPPSVYKGDTSAIVWQKLREKMPDFLGLMISFWLIGSAWLRHHQLFRYIDRYDLRFMKINLALLFTIILFPFSTSFLFNSILNNVVTKPQAFFYLAVPLCSNFILYRMFKLVNKKYRESPADSEYHKAIYQQGFMVISFLLTLTWIVIMPIKYHPYGYIFLMLGPLMNHAYKKLKKIPPDPVINRR